jgi:hypothetical protein
MGPEEAAGRLARQGGDSIGFGGQVARQRLGSLEEQPWVWECIAMAWPSAATRLRIGAVSAVTYLGMMKKVAFTFSRASTSSNSDVTRGFGPSSYVR